jgi:hypothetical protein
MRPNRFSFPLVIAFVLLSAALMAQPGITSVTPNEFFVGDVNVPITVNGFGFDPGSIIYFNDTPLVTTRISFNQLTGVVPANALLDNFTAGVFVVSGNNNTNAVNVPIRIRILGLEMESAVAGGFTTGVRARVTRVPGNGPLQLLFDGQPMNIIGTTVDSITFTVPSALLATPRDVPVVVNAVGQPVSNTAIFRVVPPVTLTSVSPTSADAGGPSVTVTVTGANFSNPSTILFGGLDIPTTYVSSTQLVGQIPAGLLEEVRPETIRVRDNARQVSQNSLTLNVVFANPVITNINPFRVATGAPTFTMLVTGSRFLRPTPRNGLGSVVYFTPPGGQPVALQTTFESSGSLLAQVPANLLIAPGIAQVQVRTIPNLTNGQSFNSNLADFSIGTLLTLTNMTPSSARTDSPGVVITLEGTGFVPSSVVRYDGLPLPTTYVSPNLLTAVVDGNRLGFIGTFRVVVANGNAVSNPLIFTVVERDTPNTGFTLTSITPSFATVGSGNTPATLTGTGFRPGATVNFGAASISADFINDRELRIVIPSNLLNLSGTYQVAVLNPGGQVSNSLPFTVDTTLSITSLDPASVSAGAGQVALNINGLGFLNGARARWNAVDLQTGFVSGNRLSAIIPFNFVAQPGTATITVQNPNGAVSNEVTFTVVGIRLDQISPNQAQPGAATFTMSLLGSGFLRGATVSFGGTTVPTTFESATSLTAVIDASLLRDAGVRQVTVSNPDGGRSNSLPFTLATLLTLTSVTPDSVEAGLGRNLNVVAVGTGFAPGASLQLGGRGLATTFISNSQLEAVVPADLIETAGNLTARVTNPNGDQSNGVPFRVTPVVPTLTSVNPSSATAGQQNDVRITGIGSNFRSGAGLRFGTQGLGTDFISATQLSAVIPASFLRTAGPVQIRAVNPDGTESNPVTFTVFDSVGITGLSPSTAVAGSGDTSLTVTGAGFVTGSRVSFGSAGLATSFVSGSQLTALIPRDQLTRARAVPVTVSNPSGATSDPVTFTITEPLTVPPITLTLPVAVQPAGSARVTITLAQAVTFPVQGTLALSFRANALNVPDGYIDPALQFAGGGRTVDFSIAAGSTTAVIPNDGGFSPGTVAGTITLTITRLVSGGQNVLPSPAPTRDIVIDRGAPVILPGSVRIINASGSGFEVELFGYTTSREVTRAVFTFSGGTVPILGDTVFTVDVGGTFSSYFSSDAGRANGGSFRFRMPFTLQGGDASAVQSVSVTLTNSVGTSAAVSGGR